MPLTLVPTALVTLAALVTYLVLSANVARARGRYAVPAPATDGHPDFARVYRVQQNTLEQLVLFLPVLWLFALTIGNAWLPLIGLLWPVGRIVYARAYYRDAEKRGPGFVLTLATSVVLLIGAVVGLIRIALGA